MTTEWILNSWTFMSHFVSTSGSAPVKGFLKEREPLTRSPRMRRVDLVRQLQPQLAGTPISTIIPGYRRRL